MQALHSNSQATASKPRLNLGDAVDDLAPPPPPCFLNNLSWIEYLYSAAAVQNHKGEPRVIMIVNSEPVFDLDFAFCADCTQIKSLEMTRKGKCDPQFLTRMKL